MEWWSEVKTSVTEFLDHHGLLAAFVIILIEEAGVPVPVPGDFLMLLLGVQAQRSGLPWWETLLPAILAMELATVLGATFLYTVSRVGGRGVVYRYGRFIRLTPERLDRAEHWVQGRGFRAVLLGRLLPGLRIVTAVACGVFSVSAWTFIPAMSLGALLYLSFYTLLGYVFGPPVLELVERLQLPLSLIGSLVLLLVLVGWVLRARRELARDAAGVHRWQPDNDHRLRAGVAAGLLATVVCTLVLNVLVNASNLAFQTPGTLVEQTAARLTFTIARGAEPLALFVAVPAYVLVGVLWGAVYAHWGEAWLARRLRTDLARGLLFALLPLAVSLLAVMPALGLGVLGGVASGPIVAASEAVRHAAYGAMLSWSFPVLLQRRRVKVVPHADAESAPAEPDAAGGGPLRALRRR